MATKPELERERVIRKMIRNRDQLATIEAAKVHTEVERAAIYAAGRELDPPMTFKEIAEVYGITEAAVAQKVKRYYEEQTATAV